MQFNPKSREELDAAKAANDLIPKGVYDAECTHAEDATSKTSGNEMLKLQWRVFVGETQRVMFDYIVPNNDMAMDKLYSLCHSVGFEDDYDNGSLNAQAFVGQCCKVNVTQRKQKGGEYDGQMQNSIAGYMHVKATGPAATPPAQKSSPADSEDSPFM